MFKLFKKSVKKPDFKVMPTNGGELICKRLDKLYTHTATGMKYISSTLSEILKYEVLSVFPGSEYKKGDIIYASRFYVQEANNFVVLNKEAIH